MALLDTTALIDLSRSKLSPNHQRIVALIQGFLRTGQIICTSRINEAEFRVGGFRSPDPKRETQKIEAILSKVVILEFDGSAAIRFAEMQAHLLGIGRPTGRADALIAAVASVNRQVLVTRNPKDFADFPAVSVLSY
jgi:predicted nucleic acid-binding protein